MASAYVFVKPELPRQLVHEGKGGKLCAIYQTTLYIGSSQFVCHIGNRLADKTDKG